MRYSVIFGIALSSATALAGASVDRIEALVADRLSGRDNVGIVVGVLEPGGTRIVTKGKGGEGPAAPALGGDTVFEIGGASDPFVALLLADMVQRGEVQLSDPLARYLADVAVPERGGKKITLEDLVMHRSGLPRVPANLPRREDNPYAAYTGQMLADFLGSHELLRDIGERHDASPFETGLLGDALAARAGKPLDHLLKERVLDPLGLTATTIGGEAKGGPQAIGHSPAGKPLPPARFQILSAAGGVRSTADDLLKFLSLNIKPSGPLAALVTGTHSLRGRIGAVQDNLGLGWRVRGRSDQQVFWCGGRAGGFYAFIGFEPASGRGIVVLHNQAVTLDDVGFAILEQLREAATPVDTDALRGFAGEYEITRTVHITITVEGRRLVAEITGEPPDTLTQDSELRFVFDRSEARLTFVRDASGAIIGLWLHRNSRNEAGRRVR